MSRHRFEAYLDKVFGFSDRVPAMPEGRQSPRHPWPKIFDAVFLGAAMQMPSLLQIEAECRRGALAKRIGPISDDTIGYALQRQSPEPLFALGCQVADRLKRNGVLRSDWSRGLIVAAVDGIEICSSVARCCDACMQREVQHKIRGELRTDVQYYHRIVAVVVVSTLRHSREITQVCSPKVTHHLTEGRRDDAGFLRQAGRCLPVGESRRWRASDMKTMNLPEGNAFGVDDDESVYLYVNSAGHRAKTLFFLWVTLTERKWVILGERRGFQVLDPVQRTIVWESSTIEAIVHVTPSTVVAVTADRRVEARSSYTLANAALRGYARSDGRVRWSISLADPYVASERSAVVGDLLAVIDGISDPALLVLNPETG